MTTAKRRSPFVIALFALVLVGPAFAQDTPIGTLTIPEVTQQPVELFSAGVSYSIPAPSGGGGAQGAVRFSTFSLTKLVDATSPNLLVSAASGRIFPAAKIDLYDPAGTTVVTSYELSNLIVLGAVVRSMQIGTTRTLTEEVSLDYQRIKQTVMTPTGPVTGCWDRSQNAPC